MTKITFIKDNVAETYENLNPGDKASNKLCSIWGCRPVRVQMLNLSCTNSTYNSDVNVRTGQWNNGQKGDLD